MAPNEATQYQPMSINDLIRVLQRFQSDATHNGLAGRWLGAILQPVLDAACQVGNSRLSEENQKGMNAFRAVELDAEIERKRKDIAALERDLKKVRAA